jgi:hypothetical protein
MHGLALASGHSTPSAFAIIFLVLALVTSLLRYRARGRGSRPHGGQRAQGFGPRSGGVGGTWGGGPSGTDVPIQWDIRRPSAEASSPEAPNAGTPNEGETTAGDVTGGDPTAGDGATSEEHHPPGDP